MLSEKYTTPTKMLNKSFYIYNMVKVYKNILHGRKTLHLDFRKELSNIYVEVRFILFTGTIALYYSISFG